MLKPTLMLVAVMLLFHTPSDAQMPYDLTVLSQPYTPLSSTTSLNGGTIWNSNYTFVIPVGFSFKMDTIHCSNIFLESGNSINSDTSALIMSGFSLTDAVFADRGELSGVSSLSPVRYSVTGAPGNRILKIEVFNAGFEDELLKYGTMDDSANVQYWLYEGSNIVELRYGPSKISHSDIYFSVLGGPIVGYAKDEDTSGNGVIYVLVGDAASPTMDSLVITNGSVTHIPSLLFSYPPDGTVYRFTPKTTSVKNITSNTFRVYPTKCSSEITVESDNNEPTTHYTIISVAGIATNISGILDRSKTLIDVSTLTPGMYLLQIHNNTGSITQKIIKQ